MKVTVGIFRTLKYPRWVFFRKLFVVATTCLTGYIKRSQKTLFYVLVEMILHLENTRNIYTRMLDFIFLT